SVDDEWGRAAVDVAIRVGISVGDVTLEDGDCFGTPVIEASRLCAAAAGDQILIGELVRLLARGRGGHEFQDAGTKELKGLPEPVHAFNVCWPRVAAAIPIPGQLAITDLPLVGRDVEMDTIQRA